MNVYNKCRILLQPLPDVPTLALDSCQLAVGIRKESILLSGSVRNADNFKLFPGTANAKQLLAVGSGDTNAAKQRQTRKAGADCSGAWVRKVRARRQGVTLYTDSLTNLRAELVSDSGPFAKRPTDGGMQQMAGHGYLGVLCPARSLPQKVCSQIEQYSTVQYMTAVELNVIRYPEWTSEFELQAELYGIINYGPLSEHCCARGEVRSYCAEGVGNYSRECRFDLVVFDRSLAAVAIIECKSPPKTKKHSLKFDLPIGCRQHRRYSKFGVPVIRCGHRDQFPGVIQRVVAALGIAEGPPLWLKPNPPPPNYQ